MKIYHRHSDIENSIKSSPRRVIKIIIISYMASTQIPTEKMELLTRHDFQPFLHGVKLVRVVDLASLIATQQTAGILELRAKSYGLCKIQPLNPTKLPSVRPKSCLKRLMNPNPTSHPSLATKKTKLPPKSLADLVQNKIRREGMAVIWPSQPLLNYNQAKRVLQIYEKLDASRSIW